jgi:hypothetical protein
MRQYGKPAKVISQESYFILGSNGAVNKFPIVSSTGKTCKMILITNTNIAYFQFNKINAIKMPQPNKVNIATQDGNKGSSGGRIPSRFAWMNLLSNAEIDSETAYKNVRAIISGNIFIFV